MTGVYLLLTRPVETEAASAPGQYMGLHGKAFGVFVAEEMSERWHPLHV